MTEIEYYLVFITMKNNKIFCEAVDDYRYGTDTLQRERGYNLLVYCFRLCMFFLFYSQEIGMTFIHLSL